MRSCLCVYVLIIKRKSPSDHFLLVSITHTSCLNAKSLVVFRLGAAAVSGWLGTPTNVRLTSYNMDLVLRWDPPVDGASGLVYTAEYK